MTKVQITPEEQSEVQQIYQLNQSDEVLTFQINTKSKRPEATAYLGDSGVLLNPREGEMISVVFDDLPFEQCSICSETGRYCLYVALISSKMFERLSFQTEDWQILFEKPI